MNASFQRFEMLLPRQFNDGETVPDELIADTLLELRERFGAVSSETQIIREMGRYHRHIALLLPRLLVPRRLPADTLTVCQGRRTSSANRRAW